MSLTIRHAVLHILYNDGRASAFSDTELDIDSEVCEAFIQKHVRKLLDNPAARAAAFNPQAEVYALLSRYQGGQAAFAETALAVARRLDAVMAPHADIAPCALLIAHTGVKKGDYIAILKLNYQEIYTHTNQSDNQLVKLHTALPFNSGKVEDACVIAIGEGGAMRVNVMEKPCVLDGESVMYFSERFLECDTTPSRKETAQLIGEITQEFVQEYYNNDPRASAQFKTAMVAEAEAEDGFITMENVAAQVFEANDEAKKSYIGALREAGIRADVDMGAKLARQQFGIERIKADNGVEVKIPAELAADEDSIEITPHADGTVTVLLKRLRMV